MTPQPTARFRLDWKSVSSVISILVLLSSLVFSYASGTAENKAATQRHDAEIEKHEKKIDQLQEKKADKEDLQRLEDKLDKQNDKLDRILFEVAKHKK